jgi:SHS2 domain-containing protein
MQTKKHLYSTAARTYVLYTAGSEPEAGGEVKAGSWEHFHHVADIGIRGCGGSVSAAFEQASLALTAIITDPGAVEEKTGVGFALEGLDLDLLFYDWINALIYEMAVRRMLFGKSAVTIKDNVLKATAWGETVDRTRHAPAVEVKGATFTELKVYRRENGIWVAQCVVDV